MEKLRCFLRKGNRMVTDVMTSKTEALGWKAKYKLKDYIEKCKKNGWN